RVHLWRRKRSDHSVSPVLGLYYFDTITFPAPLAHYRAMRRPPMVRRLPRLPWREMLRVAWTFLLTATAQYSNAVRMCDVRSCGGVVISRLYCRFGLRSPHRASFNRDNAMLTDG